MNKILLLSILYIISPASNAKCSLDSLRGDWHIAMTFMQLEDPSGEDVAQRAGELFCNIKFDKNGSVELVSSKQCQQYGLSEDYGQIVKSEIINDAANIDGTCRPSLRLQLTSNVESKTHTIQFSNLVFNKGKNEFISELDVLQPDDQIWHAGKAQGLRVYGNKK